MTRQRVSYFYHNDVGNYQYAGDPPSVSNPLSAVGKGQHPMKPHRMRMVHDLIVNYDIHRKLDMCVWPPTPLCAMAGC
jgi:histone deacetylase 1/2